MIVGKGIVWLIVGAALVGGGGKNEFVVDVVDGVFVVEAAGGFVGIDVLVVLVVEGVLVAKVVGVGVVVGCAVGRMGEKGVDEVVGG